MKRKIVFLLAILAVTCLAAVAVADTLAFDLNVTNISTTPGPYVHVVVNRTSDTTATFTFTSLTNSGNIYLLGGEGAAAVNINASSFTLGAITGSNAGTGFTPGPFSSGGAGNEDGFGSFNLTITSFDGFTHASDTISFSVTNTSGTWATVNDVLIGNGQDRTAAAHIFVTADPANTQNGAIVTGFATNGPPVPVPPTALLLGSGLLGLVALGRRRKK